MKKLIPLLTLAIWCSWSPVYGQSSADNAAAPYRFANNNQLNNSLSGNGTNAYSVDLYTGAANINIPIYNYTVDGINAGISLSYNTQGIKVDQLASSVGLGWGLNAAPCITRQVNGLEDEATLPALGWVNFANVLPQMSGAWGFHKPEKDNDVFSINFGNRSVDFILEFPDLNTLSPGHPVLIGASDNANIHVAVFVNDTDVTSFQGPTSGPGPYETWGTNNSYRFDSMMETQPNFNVMSFKVTDDLGNTYYFDRGDYEYKAYVDTTVSGTHNTFIYYPVDKWNLTKLITCKGNVINYKYNHYDNISYPLYQERQIKETREYRVAGNINNIIEPSLTVLVDSVVNWRGTMSQISEIDYPNGVVAHFNVHSTDRLDLTGVPYISNITLEGTDNANVDNKLEYNLNYSYFNTDPNNPDVSNEYLPADEYNYRLKLNGIDRIGTDYVTYESYYTFNYNMSSLLPQRLSPFQDAYGYYNGPNVLNWTATPATGGASTVNTGVISSPDITFCPLHTFNYLFGGHNYSVTYGIDKTDNISYSQSCILDSMSNGLGGTTSFFYKAHQLNNPPQDTYNTTTGVMVGPHYYDQANYSVELPPDDNPSLNMEYTNVNDGVCLDSILNKDGYNPDNNTVTRYNFQNGMRFFTGGYYWYPTVTENGAYPVTSAYWPNFPIMSIDSLENTWDERVYTNTILSSQDQINGANHGYSDVTVTTYGYNDEFISSEHTRFTNVISQAGEFDSIIRDKPAFDSNFHKAYPVNSSRILASCGLFMHMLPRFFMDKHLMGLPVEIDDFDRLTDTTHKTVNLYRESINDFDTPAWPISDYYPTRTSSTKFGVNINASFSGNGLTTLYWQYIPFSAATALLVSSTSSDYSNGRIMSTAKTYGYDNMDNVAYTNWYDSKGVLNTINNGITYIAPAKYKVTTGASQYKNNLMVSATGLSGTYTGIPYKITSLNTEQFITPNTGGIWDYTSYTVFDANNNVCETWHKNTNEYSSALWDSRIGKKVASVVNSRYTDMAYTSFEGNYLSGLDSNKGHWTFDSSMVTYDPASKPMTGKYYYNLVGNDQITSEYPLTNGKTYYISFWAQGTYLNAYLKKSPVPSSIALTAQNTINGWTLYTGYVTGNGNQLFLGFASSIGLNPTGVCKLDELRLYPADAAMETFTYEPLLGASSHCDDRNNITYMQYDVQGRPSVTRDINGNIITVTQHINQGTDN